MKTRLGFVSNSSSSSFICDVCGQEASGWDMCLSDAEMYECENGHTFCRSEIIDADRKDIITALENHRWLEVPDNIEEYTSIDDFCDIDDFEYEIPECCCPICTFNSYSDSMMNSYIFKKYGIDKAVLFKEIKDKFGVYSKFQEYLKS